MGDNNLVVLSKWLVHFFDNYFFMIMMFDTCPRTDKRIFPSLHLVELGASLQNICMSLWISITSGSGLFRAFVFLGKDSFGSPSALHTRPTHESFKTLSDDDETWTRRWNCHISSDCLFRIRFGLSISVNFFPQTSTTRFHGMDADFFLFFQSHSKS